MIRVQLDGIEDDKTKEALRKIVEEINSFPILKGTWQFIEFTTASGAISGQRFNHRLGFKPLDVILLSTTGGATVTWSYADFTSTTIKVSTSAPTTVRAFIGSYKEG